MIQGIYIASMGMTALLQKQDQLANNLANTNTAGFKQSNLFLKSYQKYLANDLGQPYVNGEIKADEVYVDYSEGPIRRTNSPLDLSIQGSGFFTVMTPEGVRYTRNGNFSIDTSGFLVAADGSKVMSTEGFIRVRRDIPVAITEKGEITQNGERLANLRIGDFKKPYRLLRSGTSCFRPQMPENPEIESAGFAIRSGYLEGANVDMIRNMVQMIGAYRNFEADQRALLAQDETLEKAVNQVGRVG